MIKKILKNINFCLTNKKTYDIISTNKNCRGKVPPLPAVEQKSLQNKRKGEGNEKK